MNVADLRQHLLDLSKLLDVSGGKTAAKDLTGLAEALAPFTTQTPAEFTQFLARAHEYHTTGKLEAPVRASRASKAAASKADPGEVVTLIRSLYDRAGDLTLTISQIETDLAHLKKLKKEGLLQVCSALELEGMAKKTVAVIIGAIRQKILDRRSAAQRAQMILNPTGVEEPIMSDPTA